VAEVDGLSLFLLAYKLVYYTESTRKLYVLAMDLKAEKVVSAAGFAWLQGATIRNPTSAETVKAGALTQDTECGVIHLPMHGASHATSSQNPQETQEALNAPRRSKRKQTATENDAHVPHKPVAPRKVKKTKRPSEVSSELAEPVIDDVMAECKHCFSAETLKSLIREVLAEQGNEVSSHIGLPGRISPAQHGANPTTAHAAAAVAPVFQFFFGYREA